MPWLPDTLLGQCARRAVIRRAAERPDGRGAGRRGLGPRMDACAGEELLARPDGPLPDLDAAAFDRVSLGEAFATILGASGVVEPSPSEC